MRLHWQKSEHDGKTYYTPKVVGAVCVEILKITSNQIVDQEQLIVEVIDDDSFQPNIAERSL